MSKRREGREAAIQYLYQLEVHGDRTADLHTDFWNLREAKASVRDFANNLIAGVNAHITDVDDRIKKYVINFEIGRLAAVDRNILRLAIYEMLYCMRHLPSSPSTKRSRSPRNTAAKTVRDSSMASSTK